jgi:hypothetical protein
MTRPAKDVLAQAFDMWQVNGARAKLLSSDIRLVENFPREEIHENRRAQSVLIGLENCPSLGRTFIEPTNNLVVERKKQKKAPKKNGRASVGHEQRIHHMTNELLHSRYSNES